MTTFNTKDLMAIAYQAEQNLFNARKAKEELLMATAEQVPLAQERLEAIADYKTIWTQIYNKASAMRREL